MLRQRREPVASAANGHAQLNACLTDRLRTNDDHTLAIPREGPHSECRCPSAGEHGLTEALVTLATVTVVQGSGHWARGSLTLL